MGENTDAAPGDLPDTINRETYSASAIDLLDAENGGFLLGDTATGLRVSGILGGLIDPDSGASGACEAWGSATIDS